MDWSNSKGPPIAAAVIVILAIALLGSITIAFSGSVHF